MDEKLKAVKEKLDFLEKKESRILIIFLGLIITSLLTGIAFVILIALKRIPQSFCINLKYFLIPCLIITIILQRIWNKIYKQIDFLYKKYPQLDVLVYNEEEE